MTSNSNVSKDLIIVTPCSRPENLQKLYDSINFDKITLWLIIYDTRNLEFVKRFDNSKIVELECKDEGVAGHQIRNMALNIIMNGLVYFLDDDNIIHPFFWNLVDHFNSGYIYTFNLLYKSGDIKFGNNPTYGNIDTSQFVFDKSLVSDLRYNANNYSSDGYFINSLVDNNKEKTMYFNYIAAYYNWLNDKQPFPIP